MKITYSVLVMEDSELVVTAPDEEAVQPAFDTPVKNYRIMEGMGVIFHCKMAGNPLPKVQRLLNKLKSPNIQEVISHFLWKGEIVPIQTN